MVAHITLLIAVGVVSAGALWVKFQKQVTDRLAAAEDTKREKIRADERLESIRLLTRESAREIEFPLRKLVSILDNEHDE